MGTAPSSPIIPDPAHHLLGRDLDDGWRVVAAVPRLPSDTGGTFSVSYRVQHSDGRAAFLKALDYSAALRRKDAAQLLQFMTESYNFERSVLADCHQRGMNRIVRILASGTLLEPEFGHAVDYLIFEPADGDVR